MSWSPLYWHWQNVWTSAREIEYNLNVWRRIQKKTQLNKQKPASENQSRLLGFWFFALSCCLSSSFYLSNDFVSSILRILFLSPSLFQFCGSVCLLCCLTGVLLFSCALFPVLSWAWILISLFLLTCYFLQSSSCVFILLSVLCSYALVRFTSSLYFSKIVNLKKTNAKQHPNPGHILLIRYFRFLRKREWLCICRVFDFKPNEYNCRDLFFVGLLNAQNLKPLGTV